MKRLVKGALLRTLYYSGTNRLVRHFYRGNPRILMLHRIAPSEGRPAYVTDETFELLVRYVRNHYRPAKITDLLRFKQREGRYPDNAVAITFDDGFKSFYDIALPILRDYQVPATVFVCPMLTDCDSWIWPDRLSYVYRRGFGAHCDLGLDDLLTRLKRTPALERDEFIAEAYRSSGISEPEIVPEPFRLMSWEMLREACRSSLVEVGAHTLTHPVLSMEDTETCWREISGSKKMLEDTLEVPVNAFCFPNGMPGDYEEEHLEMLRRAEYRSGIASHFGFVTPDSNEMALPRIPFGTGMYSTYKQLDGIELLQRKLTG